MTEPVAGRRLQPANVVAVCHDGPDSAAARQASTPDHLRWVESMLEQLALAGPLYTDDGARMVGSLYVFRTASSTQARAWLESDPYFAAGFNCANHTPYDCETVTGTSYLHASLDTPADNTAYVVRAINACGTAAGEPPRAGEFKYTLTPGN